LFATKTEASLLRMLKGSPDVYLSGPIQKYITDRGGRYDPDIRILPSS
jgi:zeta-carotene desaturase